MIESNINNQKLIRAAGVFKIAFKCPQRLLLSFPDMNFNRTLAQ
jgi:hypothetical protein